MSKEFKAQIKVNIINRQEQRLYGLWGLASINSEGLEEETLFSLYASKRKDGGADALYMFRERVDENGSYELFVGGEEPGEELEALIIPAGEYALIEVKPFLGLFWKRALDYASRFIRFKWTEASGRQLTGQRLEIRSSKGGGACTELMYRLK